MIINILSFHFLRYVLVIELLEENGIGYSTSISKEKNAHIQLKCMLQAGKYFKLHKWPFIAQMVLAGDEGLCLRQTFNPVINV